MEPGAGAGGCSHLQRHMREYESRDHRQQQRQTECGPLPSALNSSVRTRVLFERAGRHRHTDTDTDTTHKPRETIQRQRQTRPQPQTHRHTDTQADKGTQTQKTHTHTPTHRHRRRHTRTHEGRQKYTHSQRHVHAQTHTHTHTHGYYGLRPGTHTSAPLNARVCARALIMSQVRLSLCCFVQTTTTIHIFSSI